MSGASDEFWKLGIENREAPDGPPLGRGGAHYLAIVAIATIISGLTSIGVVVRLAGTTLPPLTGLVFFLTAAFIGLAGGVLSGFAIALIIRPSVSWTPATLFLACATGSVLGGSVASLLDPGETARQPAVVVGGPALLVTLGVWLYLRRLARPRPTASSETRHRPGARNSWIVPVASVLGLAIVAVFAWIVVPNSGGDQSIAIGFREREVGPFALALGVSVVGAVAASVVCGRSTARAVVAGSLIVVGLPLFQSVPLAGILIDAGELLPMPFALFRLFGLALFVTGLVLTGRQLNAQHALAVARG